MKEYQLAPITETAVQARETKGQKGKIAKQILLGIDAHLKGYQVCRKIDAGGLQPVQSFSLEKLLLFGYKQLGIEALVCAPECLEAGSKRKHNKIDASKLTGRLYSYLGGDRYALRIVRVPSPEQERLRARSRQHDQLVRTRKALGAQGRSLMLTQGYGINGSWWRAGTFDKLRVFLPEWISQELAVWQSSLLLLDQQIAQLKTELGQSLQGPRPKGFGALSLTQLDREVFDYHRFANARSVGCFGGLCPSEHSTGDRSN